MRDGCGVYGEGWNEICEGVVEMVYGWEMPGFIIVGIERR